MIYDNIFSQIFDGNVDANTVKKVDLEFPIIARYIRFNPQRWHGYIAMRVEVYGCTFGEFKPDSSTSFYFSTRNVCVALVCPAKRRSHGTPVN